MLKLEIHINRCIDFVNARLVVGFQKALAFISFNKDSFPNCVYRMCASKFFINNNIPSL